MDQLIYLTLSISDCILDWNSVVGERFGSVANMSFNMKQYNF